MKTAEQKAIEQAPEAKQQPSKEPVGLNLGNKAPEIEGLNPADSLIRLSSLKGKLVLIDFWASWCAPCRMENPNLVKNHEEFKDKKFKNGNGFTVLGVSLDENKKSWLAAIKKDNLMWPWHISDLKGWNSKHALMYNITGIPYNYLLDENGIIIAKNLRKEELSQKLTQLLAQE